MTGNLTPYASADGGRARGFVDSNCFESAPGERAFDAANGLGQIPPASTDNNLLLLLQHEGTRAERRVFSAPYCPSVTSNSTSPDAGTLFVVPDVTPGILGVTEKVYAPGASVCAMQPSRVSADWPRVTR